jgi:hypothetical protein
VTTALVFQLCARKLPKVSRLTKEFDLIRRSALQLHVRNETCTSRETFSARSRERAAIRDDSEVGRPIPRLYLVYKDVAW